MTQTTIKQHLTDAIYKNELLCKLGNGDHDGNSNGNVIAQDIRRHLSAIESKLDAPMKSAEEWACYYLGLDTAPSNKGMGFQTMVSFVQRVQFDAIASKNIEPRPKPPLTKEHASWVADKLHALGDYAREAAWMLNNWPDATASKVPEVDLRKLAEETAIELDNKLDCLFVDVEIGEATDIIHAALLKVRGEK